MKKLLKAGLYLLSKGNWITILVITGSVHTKDYKLLGLLYFTVPSYLRFIKFDIFKFALLIRVSCVLKSTLKFLILTVISSRTWKV